MQYFRLESLDKIIRLLQEQLKLQDIVEFGVVNPDIDDGVYAGQEVYIDKEAYIYRDYKNWSDLANILKCKMLIPIAIDKNIIKITYKKLKIEDSFHKDSDSSEKYGVDSMFANIHKGEESIFLHYYLKALELTNIDKKTRVLNLGINSGEEFEIIKRVAKDYKSIEFVGLDYCQSAIDRAKDRLDDDNFVFMRADINELESLDIGKFDLIITIGTLQSSNINFKERFMYIVQNHLNKDGAMILGFPNCRWIDGTIVYGAMAKNYPFSEMSLLIKDIHFCKKYLQQKKFRVMVMGREYIFLVARSIR
jgi:hypothetical protein